MRTKAGRGRRAGAPGASRIPELIGFVAAAALFLALAIDLRPGQAQSTNTTATVSTTTGTGSSLGGAQSLQFLASAGVLAQLQKITNTNVFTGTAGGTTITVMVGVLETIGPSVIPIGTDVGVCNGPPSGSVWPAPNCTYSPGATLFTVLAGTSNFNFNVHTQTNTVLGAESPLFGLVLGDFHPAFQTALLDQSWSFVDALFAQLRGFGVNGAGPSASAGPFGGQLASIVGDELSGGVNIAQAGTDGRMRPSPWFVWVRPHGTLGKVDSSDERLGFRYDIAGVSAGAEYRWPGPWRAGVMLGYAHASITQATSGDKGGVDSLQIGAYGGYRDMRTHIVAAALFQQNWISSERLTLLAPTIASASYTAQSYSVGIEAGRKYPVMGAWVQPLASLVFTHLRQGGFTETGTTLLEIAGDARSVNALKLSLGARAWRDFDLFGATLTPEVRARWVQDLLNERRAITGRFVGDPAQTAFTVNGAKPTPAAAVLGAGITLRAGDGLKLALGYDAELRANATSHTIQARLKMSW